MTPDNKRLTDWEAGNEIVKAMDALHEAYQELAGRPQAQKEIDKCRDIIRNLFAKQGYEDIMEFGI